MNDGLTSGDWTGSHDIQVIRFKDGTYFPCLSTVRSLPRYKLAFYFLLLLYGPLKVTARVSPRNPPAATTTYLYNIIWHCSGSTVFFQV